MDTQSNLKTYLLQLPLLWLSLAFVLGVALAARLALLPPAVVPVLAAALVLALVVLRHRMSPLTRLLLLAGVFLSVGVLRYQAAQPAFTHTDIAYYNDSGQYVTVRGSLARAPIYRDSYVELWVAASQIEGDGLSASVEGLIVARADLGQPWAYGDGVELTGRLRAPQDADDFAYSAYLARQGAYSEMSFAAAVSSGQVGGTWVPGALQLRLHLGGCRSHCSTWTVRPYFCAHPPGETCSSTLAQARWSFLRSSAATYPVWRVSSIGSLCWGNAQSRSMDCGLGWIR